MPLKPQSPAAPQPPQPSSAKPEIKLPLLCKAIHLARLPGQDADARYAVIWGGIREPKEGMGYVVQLTGKRTGRVLGWLRDGGKAYACDNIVREVPAGEPAVTLAVWEEDKRSGRITVPTPTGGVRMVSELTIGLGNTYAFSRPIIDLGLPYAHAKLNFREFLAVAFLAFSYLPSLNPPQEEDPAAEGAPDGASDASGAAAATGDAADAPAQQEDAASGTMTDVLDLFRAYAYPDAVDALLLDVDEGRRTSGFEKYAARILRAAGAGKLRAIAARHEIALVRLSTTRLFWTRFSAADLDPDELSVVLALETALNRLALVQRSLLRAASGTRTAEQSDNLSRYPEELCCHQDLRGMSGIGKLAPQLLEGENHENVWRTVRSTCAARGGEWDVRTRFAAACEALALPVRFAYRFTADAAAGTLAARIYVPGAAQMPQQEWSDEKGAWEDVSAQAPAAARAYGARLAALAAAAAFGTSAGIVRVQVVGCADLAFKQPLFSLTFKRMDFLTKACPALEGRADAVRTPAEAADLVSALAPAEALLGADADGAPAPMPEPEPLVPPQPELWADNRALPADLAELLCADTVSDLDVFHGEDPLAPRVAEAVELSERDPVEAARRLSDVVDALAALEMADGDDRPGLYCSNAAARLTVGLMHPAPGTRYRRVLDSSYDARLYLSRLCRRNDDAQHAEDYARQCVELGPTSAQGYLDRGVCLMDLHRPEAAMACYKTALGVEVSTPLHGYLYYRLAFACWRAGETHAALACYTMVADDPRVGLQAREERAELLREMKRTEPPTRAEAERTLARSGIPVAPAPELLDYAADLAVRLMDAGFTRAAAPLARLVAVSERGDVLSMLANSLE